MSFIRAIEVEFRFDDGSAFTIDQLRISFSVKKTSEKKSNEAKISIYNLSRVSYDKISKVDNTVILRAGYYDETEPITVLMGKVLDMERESTYPDIITTMTLLDGQKEARESMISVSYKRGTSLKTIVRNLVEYIGFPIAMGTDYPNREYPSGYSFVGLAVDALAEVLSRIGYTYTIQNQEIYIFQYGQHIPQQAHIISPETGMINSPRPINDTEDGGNTVNINKKYAVESLLKPSIIPNSYVELRSKVVEGFFIAQTVEHTGDNWEGDFITEMEVKSE